VLASATGAALTATGPSVTVLPGGDGGLRSEYCMEFQLQSNEHGMGIQAHLCNGYKVSGLGPVWFP